MKSERIKDQSQLSCIQQMILTYIKKSLGTIMLDILEKQIGPELLALSMKEIKKKKSCNLYDETKITKER